MKVIVTAPRGKMGKLITQVAASRDDMELVAGIGPKGAITSEQISELSQWSEKNCSFRL